MRGNVLLFQQNPLSDTHNNEQNKTKLLKSTVHLESFRIRYNHTSKTKNLLGLRKPDSKSPCNEIK